MSSDQIQALKDEIWRRARERAENILKNAREEAERILEEARRASEESLRSRVEPEKILMRRRLIGRAVSEGRRMVILAKNELVEKAFQKALEKLKKEAELKSEAYRSFLLKSLRSALDNLPTSNNDVVLIYANESDTNLLKDMVKELSSSQINIKFKKADIVGGMIISEADGRRVFYNSIESRLEALKPILREKVASILFKGVEEI